MHIPHPKLCWAIPCCVFAFQAMAAEQPMDGIFQARVETITITNQAIGNAAVELRRQGFPICLEFNQPRAVPVSIVSFKTDTFARVLEQVAATYPEYTYNTDKNTGMVNIFPKGGALSQEKIGAVTITEKSVYDIFQDNLARAKSTVSLFLARGNLLGFKQLVISVDFHGGTLSEYLNAICLAIGDGTTWTLFPHRNGGNLLFHFRNPFTHLKAYKGDDTYRLPIPKQIERYSARLAGATSDKEKSGLCVSLGVLYSQSGNKKRAEELFAQAVDLAEDEARKWSIKEFMIQYRYHIRPGTDAEDALKDYMMIIKSCPVPSVRLGAILDAAYPLRVLGRLDEGAALLLSALKDYPDNADLIEYTMKKHFPGYVSQLPTRDRVAEAKKARAAFYEVREPDEKTKVIRYKYDAETKTHIRTEE
ncbi:MAG: tetratricopeptide repeat protein [Verrucomicrobia bacterium]|nr:tetratricopeptide repeat protein [Verrucomicrobiota bacterium]